ncbi:hypothetical protein TNCT_331771 [Trichonephila clavata]|uniref:Uncharacterized protein n=1 Tax=Trichonephila clavata TaxID=2740835 RepID=A0A8X6HPP1_TRICU|nr:hypothetical protein TNCT_331771 [Trichonephila clavata]
MKTKIIESDDSYAFHNPDLLPSGHNIVVCLIRDYHLRYSYASIQALTVIIREECQIFGARRSIRSLVSGPFCLWIRVRGVVPTFRNLHKCWVETLIVLGVSFEVRDISGD